MPASARTLAGMIIDADLSNVRVNDGWERTPREDLRKFDGAEAAVVGDALNHMTTMSGRIRRQVGEGTLIGSAFPISVQPGDNLGVWRALDDALPGDVLVINARGTYGAAILGGQLGKMMVEAGVIGAVVDGPVRDLGDLEECGLHIFATDTSPLGPTKNGPAEVGYPVACDGTVVRPGDVIIADRDGVTVVPSERLDDALTGLKEKEKSESELIAKIGSEWKPARAREN